MSNYRLIYVAHPIAGDVAGNSKKIRAIVREHNASDKARYGCVLIAPCLSELEYLDDADSEQRRVGMEIGLAVLERCEELWVYGMSEGVRREIEFASACGIPIKFKGQK